MPKSWCWGGIVLEKATLFAWKIIGVLGVFGALTTFRRGMRKNKRFEAMDEFWCNFHKFTTLEEMKNVVKAFSPTLMVEFLIVAIKKLPLTYVYYDVTNVGLGV